MWINELNLKSHQVMEKKSTSVSQFAKHTALSRHRHNYPKIGSFIIDLMSFHKDGRLVQQHHVYHYRVCSPE